jgi:phenylacetyl-CoA:acceptor oxidoreductase subunit 2
MSFGPSPWQQTAWDWRAAGNFICGGAGSGLLMFTALSGVQGTTAAALVIAGAALIGLGLLCVWMELGRPWRALNVFLHPRSSWMTREAIAATVLFPLAIAAVLGLCVDVNGMAWPPALVSLVFVYCQSRMLQAARGITAWREPLVVALLVATSLAEGAGLFWLAQPWHGARGSWLAVLFAAFLIVRVVIWTAYRQRLSGQAASRALKALDGAGRVLIIAGTVVPLALLLLGAAGVSGTRLAVLAGLLAALAGAYMKFVLITRAGYNQGFALREIPVRGTPGIKTGAAHP